MNAHREGLVVVDRKSDFDDARGSLDVRMMIT